jgi:hypothetical protein
MDYRFWAFALVAAILSLPSLAVAQQGKHQVSVELGNLSFNWQEFNSDGSLIDPQEINIVDEQGDLPTLSLGYAYEEGLQRIAANYTNSSGSVDYFGLINVTNGADFFTNLTTDYTIQTLEGEFGQYYDVDYVKPYAAFLSGYSKRERTINGTNDTTIPIPDLVETYTYFYWGLLLEAEVFSWSNFALNLGGEFRQSFKTELEVVSLDFTVPLKVLRTLKFYASVDYEFIPSWTASLRYQDISSELEKSNELDNGAFQPRSEEHHSYLGLTVGKVF